MLHSPLSQLWLRLDGSLMGNILSLCFHDLVGLGQCTNACSWGAIRTLDQSLAQPFKRLKIPFCCGQVLNLIQVTLFPSSHAG